MEKPSKMEQLYLWVPSEDGTGVVVALPSDDGPSYGYNSAQEHIEALLEGFSEAENWAKKNADVLLNAPESLERMRYIPFAEDAAFPRGAGATVWDEPLDEVPALASTGKPFDPKHVQTLTGGEVDALLRVDVSEGTGEWLKFGPSGLLGARLCMTVEPSSDGIACGLEFSAVSPQDAPDEWAYASYTSMDEVCGELKQVLERMKEEESAGPRP